MKTKLIVVAITFILGFGAFNYTEAQITQEGKIGFVNPQAILANMPEMKAVQQRLQNFALRIYFYFHMCIFLFDCTSICNFPSIF